MAVLCLLWMCSLIPIYHITLFNFTESSPSAFFRLSSGSAWRWRKEHRQQPAAHDVQPPSLSASDRPQRLPRVGPGRRNHPSVPERKPPGKPASAGRHPLHPLVLPTLAHPNRTQSSGPPRKPRANQGDQHPEGVLIFDEWPWNPSLRHTHKAIGQRPYSSKRNCSDFSVSLTCERDLPVLCRMTSDCCLSCKSCKKWKVKPKRRNSNNIYFLAG